MLSVLLGVVGVLLALIYLKGIYNQYYWKKRGVAFYDKHKTGGPLWQFAIENRSFFQILNDIYWNYEKEPAVGLGSFHDLGLFVKDLTNIQHIAQVDFHSFSSRGFAFTEDDVLAHNVLMLNGQKWKLIRQKVTPIFTTAKLKNMFYIIDKSAHDFIEYLRDNPDKLKEDLFDTLGNYCNAAIAAAVFGIHTRSTFDSPFRMMAKEVLTPTFFTNLKFAISGVSESLFKFLKLKLFKTEKDKFFIAAIKEVIRQREKENVKRHDFIDICVELQKNGPMVDPDSGYTLEPTDELMAAQAYFFFLAGTDPTIAGIFGTLMELGRHPDILRKAHEDVDRVFEKYNGQLTYDAVGEVKYLKNVLSEVFRVHPPIAFVMRQCVQDSVLPVGNIPVEKGVKIFIPVFDLHHDPNYFPEPEKFDPDRFVREGEINDATYIPFGKGGRYCIGARYAKIQVMTGLIHILRHYTVRTFVRKGGVKYNKEQFQVRLRNCDVELVPRKL